MKKRITKNIHFVLFFLLGWGFLISCENTTNLSREIQVKSTKFCDWEKIFKVVDVVPLQEDSNCLISMADHCLLSKDCLFICDYKTKEIYKFSLSGDYLGRIGRNGHGSEEYTNVYDMRLTENDSTLVVLDTRYLLFYNSNTGSLKKRIRNKSNDYERFAIQNDGCILYVPDIDGTASIISEKAEKTRELRLRKRFPFMVDTFYKYEDSCRVISDYGDFYIDTYYSGKLHKTYSIELGEKALPEKLHTRTYDEFEYVDSEPDYFKCITSACETRNTLFVRLVGPNQTYYTLFADKNNLKNIIGPSPSETGLVIIGADNNYFYALLYPDCTESKVFTNKIITDNKIQTKNPVLLKLLFKNEIFE